MGDYMTENSAQTEVANGQQPAGVIGDGQATRQPADAATVKLRQPPGLYLLFIVEMWERFSYYGMRALLVLYLVNVLKWPDVEADSLYGTYTSLVFLTPLLGGYIADR